MAGDALKDKNLDIRTRLSNDPEEAAKRAALVGDAYDVSGYSDKAISMALKGASFGDEDYARLTGKSLGNDDSGSSDGGSSDTPGVTPTPGPGPSPGPGPGPITRPTIPNEQLIEAMGESPFGGMQQNINQDNDITTSITGDNNEVTNTQDNSIRQSMGSSDYASRYARGLKDQYVLNLLDR